MTGKQRVAVAIVMAATLCLLLHAVLSGAGGDRVGDEGVHVVAPETVQGAPGSSLPTLARDAAGAVLVDEPPVAKPSATEPAAAAPVIDALPTTAPLLVDVVSRDSGHPVEGARVRAQSWDFVSARPLGTAEALTSLAGLAAMQPPVGELEIIAFTEDRRFATAGFMHAGTDESAVVRLELAGLVQVQGVVRSPDGRPLTGVRVSCHRTDGVEGAAAASDTLGRFTFDHWIPGSLTELSFRLEGYAGQHVFLIVDEESRWSLFEHGELDWRPEPPFVDVTMHPQKSIRGVVIQPNGEPVARARTRAIGWVSTSFGVELRDDAESETGEEGSFELRGLRGDVLHLVLCEATGSGLALRLAEASEGPIELGAIPLEPFAHVSGRVVDPFGRPIGGALVELMIAGSALPVPGSADRLPAPTFAGYQVPGQTEPDGRFTVSGPRVADVRLFVRAADREIARAQVDLSGGDVDLGELRSEKELVFTNGFVVDAIGMPLPAARLEITSAHGRLLAKSRTDSRGAFEFALVRGSYDTVIVMLRAADDRLTARWSRDIASFPLTLRAAE